MATSTRHLPNEFTLDEIDQIEQGAHLGSREALPAWLDEGKAYRPRGEARAPGRYGPPKVTRGESIPDVMVAQDGMGKIEPGRRGWGGDSAFCDWINFTVHESTFYWNQGKDINAPIDQIILEISYRCQYWFGFGITSERPNGANFYKRSWSLGDGVGMVCYGGQRDTVLISLSGQALSAAKAGWEMRLYEFLQHQATNPRITRCDLAHDDYDGTSYSVDQCNADYESGYFNCGGRTPECEQRGNWKKPNGKGRTFYVGNRKNGKFARVYDKGMQLGDKESPWCRIEVEFKSVDRVIPFDVLLKAGEYLAAAYPAFAFIRAQQQRIKTVKKSAQKSYQKMLDWLKHQAGAALWFAKEIEGSADALLDKIMREGVIPKRVDVPHHSTMTTPIHILEGV